MERRKAPLKIILRLLGWGLILFFLRFEAEGQQILWAKVYPLPAADYINCITQDRWGDMYAGGKTYKDLIFPGPAPRAVLYKLNPGGDTLFSFKPGIFGEVSAIQPDPYGNINVAVYKQGRYPGDPTQLHLLKMTEDGIVFWRDTIPNILYVTHSCIGKDSSWILCGFRPNDANASLDDFYIQRIRKNGTIDPFLSLNDNFSGRASRVEQLPNGKYLVSGSTGGKIISYILNEDLSNPQPFETWYQASGSNPMNTGIVSRINGNRYMIGGYGNPSVIGQSDSLKAKYWQRKDNGVQVPPQAMTDGSIAVGYRSGLPPYISFFRIGLDSQYVWNLALRDSLLVRGFPGNLDLSSFTYFEDQSAVIAGKYRWDGAGSTNTQEDPFFLRIANVGTPVTSLSKPKPGPLKNETLAPWPNPTGGTLYLKQHFDKADIRLYNLAGKEVGQYQIRFGQPIDVSHLQSGVYLYRANIDGKGYSGKIIRN